MLAMPLGVVNIFHNCLQDDIIKKQENEYFCLLLENEFSKFYQMVE